MKANTSAAVPSRQKKEKTEEKPSVSVLLLWCVMGLLVPRATLYGEMAPFGIGLGAAVGGNLPVLCSLGVGYLLAAPVLSPLRYIAAVAVVGGSRWVLSALPELEQRPFVSPVLAFVSTALSGLLVWTESGLTAYRVLWLLAESTVALGSAVFFRVTLELTMPRRSFSLSRSLTSARQTAVILSGAVGIMAASTLEVGGFAPGRVAAAVLVLAAARAGREAGGCLVGVILGAAVALSRPGQTTVAVALAFGGLLGGVFSRLGRLTMAAVFWLAAGLVTLAEADDSMLMHMYELLAAGLLYVLLPETARRKLSKLFIRSSDLPAVEGLRRLMTMRLRGACAAMEETANSLSAVSERLERCDVPAVKQVAERCRREVCASCPLRGICAEQQATAVQEAMEQAFHFLEEETAQSTETATVEEYLRPVCRYTERLAAALRREYATQCVRRSAQLRLREIQGGLQGQLRGTGQLLDSLACRLEDPRQVDVELSARVLDVCRDCGLPVEDALCTRGAGNCLTVDILAQDVGLRLDKGRWLRDIRAACDRDFSPPQVSEWKDGLRITLTEPPRYRLECGVAQRCCRGEKLCGDTVRLLQAEGQTVVLLSDGMGSGGRAAVEATVAVGLSSRLWEAGFNPSAVLQTVNAALLTKSREETLATLDVAAVDVFSGRLDVYKAGAAPSLLLCAGRVSRLERPGLPLGILSEVRYEHAHDRLTAGDILLLFSDGALADGIAAVEELLLAHGEEETMQQLADRVAQAAEKAGETHPDDVTVVALQLQQAE